MNTINLPIGGGIMLSLMIVFRRKLKTQCFTYVRKTATILASIDINFHPSRDKHAMVRQATYSADNGNVKEIAMDQVKLSSTNTSNVLKNKN